jgi:hypothetical protein
MWHFAALGNSRADLEQRQRIITRFLQLYEAAGEPEDAALYDVVDSSGHLAGVAITEQAAKCVPELLQESAPWHEMEPPGNLAWVAGSGKPN